MLPTAAIRRCKASSPALISMLLAVTAVGSNANKQAYILLFLDPLKFRFFCVCDAIALCVFLHCLRGSRLVHLLLGERTTTGKVEEETDPIKINLYLQGVHHF